MKKIIVSILFMLAAVPCMMSAADVADYNVVPLPSSIQNVKGEAFVVNANTRVVYPAGNADLQRDAEFLAEYIHEATNIKVSVDTKVTKNCIRLAINSKIQGEEAYQLSVGKKGIVIAGSTGKGVFYGVQTLRKSLPIGKMEAVELPAVKIADAPRFGYRGMMLDCSRHFFSIGFVKKFINMLALHNMNVMHRHLTDDQGWRIEI